MTTTNLFQSDQSFLKLQEENIKLKEEIKEYQQLVADAEYLKPHKTFGLTVSGDVLLNKLEVNIVNTKAFQRLRKIKQLGSTYLVYPTAIHTRFEHALGTLKQADIIINKIRKNRHSTFKEKHIPPEEEQIIRLIALLHDIGHMPFGHTIEDEFGIFQRHDKHHARWNYFLGEESEIGKEILKVHPKGSSNLYERFFNLIKCEKNFSGFQKDAFMYDIVSNTVCADLLDYLQRDCLYTHLRFRFHPRFLDYFFIKEIESGGNIERRISIRIYKQDKQEIRHDIISELIQLLRYRYYLGERVYYHHAKIATGAVISAAVLRAKKAGCFFSPPDLSSFNENLSDNEKILNIHSMGDEQLILFLKDVSFKPKNQGKIEDLNAVKRLINDFDNRILYKEGLYLTKEDIGITKDDLKNLNRIITLRNLKNEESDPTKKNKLGHKINDLEIKMNGTSTFRIYEKLLKPDSADTRLELEDSISSFLSEIQPGEVLVYCPSFDMAMKLAEVKLAYISKKSAIKNFEDEIPLREYKPTDNDETIVDECSQILDLHQELWAFRVFIHPRLLDPNSKNFNPNLKDHIIRFIRWELLNKNQEDEKLKGQEFLRNFIPERKTALLKPEEMSLVTYEDIENLISIFVSHPNSQKNRSVLDSKILEIKNAKNKK